MKIHSINSSLQQHFGTLNKYNKAFKIILHKVIRNKRNNLLVEDMTTIYIEKTKKIQINN